MIQPTILDIAKEAYVMHMLADGVDRGKIVVIPDAEEPGEFKCYTCNQMPEGHADAVSAGRLRHEAGKMASCWLN